MGAVILARERFRAPRRAAVTAASRRAFREGMLCARVFMLPPPLGAHIDADAFHRGFAQAKTICGGFEWMPPRRPWWRP